MKALAVRTVLPQNARRAAPHMAAACPMASACAIQAMLGWGATAKAALMSALAVVSAVSTVRVCACKAFLARTAQSKGAPTPAAMLVPALMALAFAIKGSGVRTALPKNAPAIVVGMVLATPQRRTAPTSNATVQKALQVKTAQRPVALQTALAMVSATRAHVCAALDSLVRTAPLRHASMIALSGEYASTLHALASRALTVVTALSRCALRTAMATVRVLMANANARTAMVGCLVRNCAQVHAVATESVCKVPVSASRATVVLVARQSFAQTIAQHQWVSV